VEFMDVWKPLYGPAPDSGLDSRPGIDIEND
jgi:hypothetical protein